MHGSGMHRIPMCWGEFTADNGRSRANSKDAGKILTSSDENSNKSCIWNESCVPIQSCMHLNVIGPDVYLAIWQHQLYGSNPLTTGASATYNFHQEQHQWSGVSEILSLHLIVAQTSKGESGKTGVRSAFPECAGWWVTGGPVGGLVGGPWGGPWGQFVSLRSGLSTRLTLLIRTTLSSDPFHSLSRVFKFKFSSMLTVGIAPSHDIQRTMSMLNTETLAVI